MANNPSQCKKALGHSGSHGWEWLEEDAFITGAVIKQVPEAFEKPYHGIKVDFKTVASHLEKRTVSASSV